jgi:hypothetical protein
MAAAATAPVTLLPQQEPHLEKLCRILRGSPFALDLSSLGSGKTYTTSRVREVLELPHIMVVSPVSVQTKWEHMRRHYGIPLVANVSFCGIKGQRGRHPKHGMLLREDTLLEVVAPDAAASSSQASSPIAKPEYEVAFEASPAFEDLVDEGLLLVIDEIQHVKNVSTQSKACQALVRHVVRAHHADRQGARSRVLLLSGSPIDKKEHAARLFFVLGMCDPHRELARYDLKLRRLVWTGAAKVHVACTRLDPGVTETIVHRYGYDLKELCYQLFQRVFKPRLSASMVPPEGIPLLAGGAVTLACSNAFYDVVDAEDLVALKKGVLELEHAVAFDKEGRVDFASTPGGSLAMIMAIGRALQSIERAKVSTFVRVVREHAAAVPTSKIVVCLNYSESLLQVVRELSAPPELNGRSAAEGGDRTAQVPVPVLVLDGSVPMQRRAAVLAKFQHSSLTHRFLVGNLGVCSTGIDLDDKHGDFPRFVMVSPNYAPISLYQLGHRFKRMDTRSSTTVHLLFGKQAHEKRILAALSRKGEIMKETTPDQALNGVTFPNDFPTFIEPGRE